MARRTVDNRLDALDVGLPRAVGSSVRVGNLNPKRDALAADTALCHWLHLLATLKLLAKHADAILADFGEKSKGLSKVFFVSRLRKWKIQAIIEAKGNRRWLPAPLTLTR